MLSELQAEQRGPHRPPVSAAPPTVLIPWHIWKGTVASGEGLPAHAAALAVRRAVHEAAQQRWRPRGMKGERASYYHRPIDSS